MMQLVRFFFLFLLFISSSVLGFEKENLESKDVQKIMQQILSQHLDKKQITASILKNSFKVYIDQFDPDRIYLLENEVQPYLSLSDEAMDDIMSQYKNNEFPEYSDLNDLIQKAIVRARNIRYELEQEKEQILKLSKTYQGAFDDEWRDPDLKRPFPKNLADLRDRIKQELIMFTAEERRRYGEGQVSRYESQMLALYEKHVRGYENRYLFVNSSGLPLLQTEKQNLFILHVLKALASSLDAHTTFYAPAEAYDMKIRLEKEFQGIGVVLKRTSSGYVIERLIEGSTAAKSGLVKIDDHIVEIDGKQVVDEPYEAVTNMLRGKNGTKVNITLKRVIDEGYNKVEKIFNLQLTRAPIVIQDDRVDISYETFGNGIIGKLTLHAFYQSDDGISSEQDLHDAIRKLQKIGNLKGLILDLRENSGGFLSQAVKVAGLFITNGVVVISKYSNGDERFYRDMDGKMAYGGPLVILTSKATASAAEIVAQALQDYGTALIVGDEQTYGKGTIQSQTVTGDQGTAYFKVTVGKYYTVSGKTPQIQGVKADIVVPSQFAKENLGEEYLEYALDQDRIPSAYKDSLSDIDPTLRPWYLRYYMPTIQQQEDVWRGMIPILKKNSSYRIAHNKDYQVFLNSQSPYPPVGHKKVNVSDLQMAEAVNIVKDMITIETRTRSLAAIDTLKEQIPPEKVGSVREVLK
jgi:carboxyl-terminal processing protease